MKEKMYNMLSLVEVMDNEEIWISIEGEAVNVKQLWKEAWEEYKEEMNK